MDGLEEIMPSGNHILYTWHIIKDIMARETTKYFPDPEQSKERMSLWYSALPNAYVTGVRKSKGRASDQGFRCVFTRI